MTTELLPVVKARFFDDDGSPLDSGQVEFLEAGTSTPKDTSQDRAGLVLNTNPVILDANGEADIRLFTGLYKVVLKRSNLTTRWTVDNVSAAGSGGGAASQVVDNIAGLKALTAGSSGVVHVLGYWNPPLTTVDGVTESADAGGGLFYWDSDSAESDNAGTVIIPDSAPGIGRWVRFFDGPVSIKWFGAVGDYILDNGAPNGTAIDNTTYINNAALYARTKGFALKIPGGRYLVSGALNIAVPMIGDLKSRIGFDNIYGNVGWSTTTDLDGCVIIWDKSTLTTSDIYMRNVSSDDSSNVYFENIAFLSKSDSGDGGGTLFVNSNDQANGAKYPNGRAYNFGNQETFRNCFVGNFGIGIKTDQFIGGNYGSIRFVGCLQIATFGILTTDVCQSMIMENWSVKNCGDASTPFMAVVNAASIRFLRGYFDTTSEISISKILGSGLNFIDCYVQNQKDNSGVGGGTFAFIKSDNTVGADVTITFANSQFGNDAGDIDLGASVNAPTLTVINSFLKGTGSFSDILLGDGAFISLGKSTTNIVSTTGNKVILSEDDIQLKGIGFRRLAFENYIETFTSTGSDDEAVILGASNGLGDEARSATLELRGENHITNPNAILKSSQGASDSGVQITANEGAGGGDVVLKAKVTSETRTETAPLNIAAGINSDLDMIIAGKKILATSILLTGTTPFAAGAHASGVIDMATELGNDVTVNTTACKTTSKVFFSLYSDGGSPTAIGIPVLVAANNGSFVVGVYASGTGSRTNYNERIQWWIIDET